MNESSQGGELPVSQQRSRFYPESRFGGFSDVDGTVAFYARVQAILTPESVVLDVGCGRGAGLQDDRVEYRRDLLRLCVQAPGGAA